MADEKKLPIEKGTPLHRLSLLVSTAATAEVFAGDVADVCNITPNADGELKTKVTALKPGDKITLPMADLKRLVDAGQNPSKAPVAAAPSHLAPQRFDEVPTNRPQASDVHAPLAPAPHVPSTLDQPSQLHPAPVHTEPHAPAEPAAAPSGSLKQSQMPKGGDKK